MTSKENMYEILNFGNPEYIPMTAKSYAFTLLGTGVADQPWFGGVDPFGVNWMCTNEGCLPEPGKFMFEEIADWKKHVKFPDVDAFDFQSLADIELKDVDRDETFILVNNVCGIFERMAAFMGFENTCIALVDDPESCHEFFEAFTDYKIKCLDRMIKAYKPDAITYFDDLAHLRGLFMSPKTYRELIKPYHKKIIDAVISKGVIFGFHICGKCDDILDDFVEMGVKFWSSAQVCNDLETIMDKYKGKLAIEGGWDSQAPCSFNTATTEQVVAEAKRCMDTYGRKGGFILYPVLLNEKGNCLRTGDPRMDELFKQWPEMSKLKY